MPGTVDNALTRDDFAAALAPWTGEEMPVLAAVSGGADSMVLLLALAQTVPVGQLSAITIDHGLRTEAADEVARVAAWCAEKGIAHETVKLAAAPKTGVQDWARQARYGVMARAAERRGAILMTAHHADDQAETVLARLARGSGVDGLSAMRSERVIAAGAGSPVRLARPFLSFRRAQLRAAAQAEGLPVSDDPSNDDPAYERVRRRGFLAAAGVQNFLTAEALTLTAARMAAGAAALEDQLKQDFNAAGGWFAGCGAIVLAARQLDDLSSPRRDRLMARAIEAVSGGDYPVSPDDVARQEGGKTVTLAGAMIDFGGDNVIVMREPAALLGRADGYDGQPGIPAEGGEILWDRRFFVKVPQDKGFLVTALGNPAAGPVTNARRASTIPVLRKDGTVIAVPQYAKTLVKPSEAPWNAAAGALHVTVLTEERFYRRVIRFEDTATC